MPKAIGQPGHHHDAGNRDHAGSVKDVNADGTVDVWAFKPTGNDVFSSVAFVDVGETPPTGTPYFQAV